MLPFSEQSTQSRKQTVSCSAELCDWAANNQLNARILTQLLINQFCVATRSPHLFRKRQTSSVAAVALWWFRCRDTKRQDLSACLYLNQMILGRLRRTSLINVADATLHVCVCLFFRLSLPCLAYNLSLSVHRVRKMCHYIFASNFAKFWSIFTTLSPTDQWISNNHYYCYYYCYYYYYHYYYIRLTVFFSRITWVSRHQKRKSFWILLEQEMMGWQWHQLDHMQSL